MSGFISAMVSSIKANRSLIKPNGNQNMFSKKIEFIDYVVPPLSREENYRIIEENKRKLNRETRIKRVFGVVIILLICLMILSI